jgi:mycothiol synthase
MTSTRDPRDTPRDLFPPLRSGKITRGDPEQEGPGGQTASASQPNTWSKGPNECFFRTFDLKKDRSIWTELNAAAFASHPEQGKWSVQDLDRRAAEGWFDPAGLIFVVPRQADGSAGRPLGYVWTKVIGRVGEIYAIGVHPKAQGKRLGTALLRHGLEYLEHQGLEEVRLFVDADNTAAIAAYRRQGFEVTRRDVQYSF